MFGVGWQELTLILFIVMLLFGAKRVPDIARSLGRAVNAFKEGLKDGETPQSDEKKLSDKSNS